MKTRLFIGNLASTVTDQELKEKFDSLLSSHKGEAEVGNAEVRCKNENNYFGFVDIHVNQKGVEGAGGGGNNGIPFFLRKYIDLMNNTKWKGSLIKVQVAKESFIDKLKREQQENRNKTEAGSSDSRNGVYAEFTDRRNTNGESSEISRNQKQANDILYKLNKQRDRGHRGNNRFQDRNARAENSGDCGFEIVSNSVNVTNQSPQKASPKKSSPPNKGSKKRPISSSSSEDDSDDEVRDGIPKFKGLLLCYPEGLPSAPPPPPVQEEPKVKIAEEAPPEEDREIQKKLLSIALNKEITEIPKVQTTKQVPSSKSAINFKKNKQQQSDLLRLQSLEKMKELKAQRKNLIKSSLSSVTASAPVTEQRKLLKGAEEDADDNDEIERKKPKMTLFDDSDDEDDDHDSETEGDAFKLKKQFEGAGGQKLLELKTRWGNDDRFKIDDRFKESDGEEELEPAEQEKEKQLDILTGILGKVVSTKGAPAKGKKGTTQAIASSSVIMPRYDPEADNESEDEAKKKQDDDKSKKSAKGEEKSNLSTEVAEKVVRSTEPATFKTVSNLKSLFSASTGEDNDKGTQNTDSVFKSSVPEQQSSFSLLATFGQKTGDEDKKSGASKSSSLAEAGPRSFWQSNPFRYDSSDDEGDNVKVTIKSKPDKPASSSLVVHGKTPFFFTENDARFEGLEDYFLKSDETSNAVNGVDGDNADAKKDPIEEYSIKRQELKSIVKAKIRNTRRKDEKRTLAIKRAIRKRKRKIHQKGRVFNK